MYMHLVIKIGILLDNRTHIMNVGGNNMHLWPFTVTGCWWYDPYLIHLDLDETGNKQQMSIFLQY